MTGPIIFYDGACPLCSRVVRFILKHERNDEFMFSSLQSKYAKEFLCKKGVYEIDMSTFYFYNNDNLHSKSTAALRLLPYLKWYWSFLNVFWFIPRFIRDYFYRIIAKYRYKIFKEKCDFDFLSKKRNLDSKG